VFLSFFPQAPLTGDLGASIGTREWLQDSIQSLPTASETLAQHIPDYVEAFMGLDIRLETETGDIIDSAGDPHFFLERLLPLPGDESGSMLSWIDRYGNTSFNHLQMKPFLKEWDQLSPRAQSPEVKELLSKIRELAVRCSKERTYHLKFIGD
jgi:hypothetical protein